MRAQGQAGTPQRVRDFAIGATAEVTSELEAACALGMAALEKASGGEARAIGAGHRRNFKDHSSPAPNPGRGRAQRAVETGRAGQGHWGLPCQGGRSPFNVGGLMAGKTTNVER